MLQNAYFELKILLCGLFQLPRGSMTNKIKMTVNRYHKPVRRETTGIIKQEEVGSSYTRIHSVHFAFSLKPAESPHGARPGKSVREVLLVRLHVGGRLSMEV